MDGGIEVTLDDLATRRGAGRTDALIFTGTQRDVTVRLAIRPSGTEPKIKSYIEIRVAPTADLADARQRAEQFRDAMSTAATSLLGVN